MTTPQLLLADALGHPSSDKRIDIVRRIGQVGSSSEAARGAGVSYRAAWQALDTLSSLQGAPSPDSKELLAKLEQVHPMDGREIRCAC